jgi:hypothetical protein
MGADGVALGPRRALASGTLELGTHGRIGNG